MWIDWNDGSYLFVKRCIIILFLFLIFILFVEYKILLKWELVFVFRVCFLKRD